MDRIKLGASIFFFFFSYVEFHSFVMLNLLDNKMDRLIIVYIPRQRRNYFALRPFLYMYILYTKRTYILLRIDYCRLKKVVLDYTNTDLEEEEEY